MPRAFISGCLGTALNRDEKAFFREADPWGLIVFKRNVTYQEQLIALTSEFREAVGRSDAPVFVDQEGGRVQRLGPPAWRSYPAAARFEKAHDGQGGARAAWLTARLIAHDLRAAGITVNCAPVLDVADDATHAVIGTRAFSHAPDTTARLARAYAEGLVAGAVAPVVKHVPGHGRARADSHQELPTVDASLAELRARDFAPFAALRDIPMAMSAHIVFKALDPAAPATISPKVVRDVIRGEIGYDGLIMSDDLSMKALSGSFAEKTRAVFAAGLDVALHCNGDLVEAAPVAANAPMLAGKSLERAQRGLEATRRAPEPLDVDAAAAELSALVG